MKNIVKGPVSRETRIKSYARMEGPKGAGRDESNLKFWADRASANSDGDQHRASDGPMKLPSTTMNQRDSGMKPFEPRKVKCPDGGQVRYERRRHQPLHARRPPESELTRGAPQETTAPRRYPRWRRSHPR